jgi:hypothetical protein
MKINEVTGSIQSVDPNTGTATIKTPNGEQDVNTSELKPNASGQLDLNAPKVATGQAVNINTNTSETQGESAYFIDMSTGKPMAKTGGIAGQNAMTPIIASTKWQEITPDIETRAGQQGYRVVPLQANGKLIKGLEGGGKIIVSPSDFQALSAVKHEERDTIAQGGGDIGGDPTDQWHDEILDKKADDLGHGYTKQRSSQNSPFSETKLNESDELYKWLTIAGLK